MKRFFVVFGVALGVALAADIPQADITNGVLKAKLYLPDTEQGYYRATRFDWAGVVASLEYKGHNFFGQWFDTVYPRGGGAHRPHITGPGLAGPGFYGGACTR